MPDILLGDLTIRVPLGTIVRDEKTGVLLGDLSTPGQTLRVANGGRGGRGNWELKNEKNTVPGYAELGEKGQARWLDLQVNIFQSQLVGARRRCAEAAAHHYPNDVRCLAAARP